MSDRINLMLHCGAEAVDRNALSGVVIPAETRSFKPIAHDYFVDLVQDELEDHGLRVVGEAHGLNKDGSNYFGVFQVAGRTQLSKDYTTVIGLRNSNVKRFAASIAVGSGVFVCDNMAFSGEVVVGHKHTTNVLDELRNRIRSAMPNVLILEDFQNKRYNAYKETDFDDWGAEKLMIDLLRKDIITPRSLPKVLEQWDNPDHAEFEHDNVWKFFNACTEAYKGLHPVNLQRSTIKLHKELDDLCEVPLLEAA